MDDFLNVLISFIIVILGILCIKESYTQNDEKYKRRMKIDR